MIDLCQIARSGCLVVRLENATAMFSIVIFFFQCVGMLLKGRFR